jgi:integrase
VVDVGKQPQQRCDRCGRVHWAAVTRLNVCDRKGCGGRMLDAGVARRQERRAGYETEAAAQTAGRAALAAVESGSYVAPEPTLTVRGYLEDTWLPKVRVSGRQPGTVRAYELACNYVIAREGATPLQKFDEATIDRMYTALKTSGKRDGKGIGLSLMHTIHVALNMAMKDAVRLNLISRNPAADLSQPAGDAPEKRTWTAEQLGTFLDATKDKRQYPLWHLLATTGMRRGEACGLRWADLQLDEGVADIKRSLTSQAVWAPPKTRRGRRQASLFPVVVADLKVWRRVQAADRLAHPGPAWDLGHVFTQPDGRPYSPETVSGWFLDAQDGLDLPRITVHGLRHTYATRGVELGENPEVIARQLGEDVATLLRTYSHVRPQVAAQSVERIAVSIPRAR